MAATASGEKRPRKPSDARRMLIAIGGMAFSTGPIFMLAAVLFLGIAYPADLAWLTEPSLASILVKSPFYGLIPGLPLAVVHVISIDLLARRGWDAIGASLATGIALSLLPAVGFVWLITADGGSAFASTDLGHLWALLSVGLPFAATGAVVSSLFWRIAIYHRRRSRLTALRDEEAIRAMS